MDRPASKDPVIEAKEEAEWIESVEIALRFFGPDLTFASLAQRFGILELSPPWPNVAIAMQKVLQQDSRTPTLTDEVVLVKAYASMLRERSKILTGTFLLAVATGKSSGSGSPFDISPGLDIVSELLSARQLPRKQLEELVTNLAQPLFVYASNRKEGSSSLTDRVPSLAVWLHEFSQLLSTSFAVGAEGLIRESVSTDQPAESRWIEFLKNAPIARDPVYSPQLDDLIRAAEGKPHLAASVSNMTLRQFWDLMVSENPGLFEAVMSFLGVGPHLLSRQERQGQRIILVVNRQLTSLMSRWKPSARHAICLVDMGNSSFVQKITSLFPRNDFFQSFRPSLLFVESKDIPSPEELKAWAMNVLGGNVPGFTDWAARISAYRVEDVDESFLRRGTPWRTIGAPSVDEAVRIATTELSEKAPK